MEDAKQKALMFNKIMFKLQPLRQNVEIKIDSLDNIIALRFTPETPSKKVILYLHGGGYIFNLQDLSNQHQYFATELAHAACAEVYALDYRTAPDNPFPAALKDAYRAYLALLAKGIKPKNIYITGDSAGGGLTIALLMKIRDEGTPMPCAAIPLSPWTDLACTGNSLKTRADIDPILTPGRTQAAAVVVLNGHSATDPYISPLYGNCEKLPPMMIFVGGKEILFDDSARFFKHAKEAGVDITLDIREDMFHVYPLFGGIIEEGKYAIQRMADFINKDRT